MKSGSGISRVEGPTWLRLAWGNCASKIAKTYTQSLVTSASKKIYNRKKWLDNISMDSQVCVFFIQLTVFEVNPPILLVGLCFFRPPLTTNKDNSPATRQVRSFELLDRIMACFFCRWGFSSRPSLSQISQGGKANSKPKPGSTDIYIYIIQSFKIV